MAERDVRTSQYTCLYLDSSFYTIYGIQNKEGMDHRHSFLHSWIFILLWWIHSSLSLHWTFLQFEAWSMGTYSQLQLYLEIFNTRAFNTRALPVPPVFYRTTFKCMKNLSFHRFSPQFQNPKCVCRLPEAILSVSLSCMVVVPDQMLHQFDFTQWPKDKFACSRCLNSLSLF